MPIDFQPEVEYNNKGQLGGLDFQPDNDNQSEDSVAFLKRTGQENAGIDYSPPTIVNTPKPFRFSDRFQTTPLSFTSIPHTVVNKPQDWTEGLYNSIQGGLAGVASPMSAALGPVLYGAPVLRPIAAGIFAGLGAKGVGEEAGHLLAGGPASTDVSSLLSDIARGDFPQPTPGLTQGQIAEGLGNIVQDSAMTLPAFLGLPRSKPEVYSPDVLPAEKAPQPTFDNRRLLEQPPIDVEEVKPTSEGKTSTGSTTSTKEDYAGTGQSREELNAQLEEEQTAKSKLYGGFFVLDPDFWRDQIGFAKDVKVDAVQMYNRLKNKIGEGSHAWSVIDTPEFKSALLAKGKVTTDEARELVEEHGPKVEVKSYGMEGKVSEAAKEYGRLQHEWADELGAKKEYEFRSAGYYDNNLLRWHKLDKSKLASFGWTTEDIEKADRFHNLGEQVRTEPRDTSPQMTGQQVGAYQYVSPKDTKKFPVQRVDVVVPHEGRNKQQVIKELQDQGYTRSEAEDVYDSGDWHGDDKGPTTDRPLWQPDSLHEQHPNTLGWAAIQYETLPDASTSLDNFYRKGYGKKTLESALRHSDDMLVINKDEAREWLRVAIEESPRDLIKSFQKRHVDYGIPINEIAAVLKIGQPDKYFRLSPEQQSQFSSFISSHAPNKGEKVAHVFEVQSRWGQEVRRQKQGQVDPDFENTPRQRELDAKFYKDKDHPLLRDYNRLILKAAIEQARKEGATKIAVSDAETAMMSEGQDAHNEGVTIGHYKTKGEAEYAKAEQIRKGNTAINIEHDESGYYVVDLRTISQEPGMRLNYDTILPRIMEELTGSKGEKVSFGEHKNAFQKGSVDMDMDGFTPEERASVGKPRSNLIFRNPDGTLKTDASGLVYDISHLGDKDWSVLQSDKYKVKKQLQQPLQTQQATQQQQPKGLGHGLAEKVAKRSEEGALNLQMVTDAIDAVFSKVGEGIDSIKTLLNDKPFRSAMMRMSGVSVPHTTALDKNVGNQLVMTAKADDIAHLVARDLVNQVLGDKWNDPDFAQRVGAVGVEDNLRSVGQTKIGDPKFPIKTEAQYQQWKNAPAIKAALERHKALIQPRAEKMHLATGGVLRKGGEETGAFFNLIPIDVETGIGGGKKGLMATLKKGTRFGKEFKGTAKEYDVDYRHMAERMIKGNWFENEKRKLYDLVDSTGFGVLQKAGQQTPTFTREMTPIPVQRRVIVAGTSPKSFSQGETLWVPKVAAEEFTQAFQVDSPLKQSLRLPGKLITEAQVSLGADAFIHISNMASALATVPEKGTMVVKTLKNIKRVWDNDPKVQHDLAQLAEKYGIVRGESENPRSLMRKILQPGSDAIHFFDKVTRLTLSELYQEAVSRGESPSDPVWRRAAVHGQVGEYNKRLLTKFQQIAKELGASPFLVAGKTFNRLAIRQAVFSPSRKATGFRGGAKMRLRQALYVAAIAVAIPLILNYHNTGSPYGRPGTKIGQIDTGKNTKDGKPIVYDVAQWMMLRRMARITGVEAVTQGLEKGQSAEQIAKQAGKDIGRGIAQPYAGPLVSVASMARYGQDVMGYRRSKETTFSGKVKEAAKELNPTVAALTGSSAEGGTSERVLNKAFSVMGRRFGPSQQSTIKSLAIDFNEREGKVTGDEPPSQYTELTHALRNGDAGEVRKSLKELREKGVKDETIKRYYDSLPYQNFTARDEATEKRFIAQLKPEHKKVYEEVVASNFKAQENFYNIVMPNAKRPKMRREAREKREGRGVQFEVDDK